MAQDQETNVNERPEFRMQKMYVKDLSFENPHAPGVYVTMQTSEPKVELNLNLLHKKIDEHLYEVALQVTVKVMEKEGDKTLFLIEVEHAGAFVIRNIPEEHVETILSVDCPLLLFPFSRQIVSQTALDGGFQPFLMEPVNFLALYQNAKAKKEASANN